MVSRKSTNNAAESLNARLREMLGNHRGMSLMRRVKAVFRWCHMHSGGLQDGRREARHDADGRRHRTALQDLLRLPEARGERSRVGRQGRVGGAPPQGPVPVVARLTGGNRCSIGTHFLPYNPSFRGAFAHARHEFMQKTPQRRKKALRGLLGNQNG